MISLSVLNCIMTYATNSRYIFSLVSFHLYNRCQCFCIGPSFPDTDIYLLFHVHVKKRVWNIVYMWESRTSMQERCWKHARTWTDVGEASSILSPCRGNVRYSQAEQAIGLQKLHSCHSPISCHFAFPAMWAGRKCLHMMLPKWPSSVKQAGLPMEMPKLSPVKAVNCLHPYKPLWKERREWGMFWSSRVLCWPYL